MTTNPDVTAPLPRPTSRSRASRKAGLRVAINLLSEDPRTPSGAYWFWTRVIPEMAKRLEDDERLFLLASPSEQERHRGYGPNVECVTYPWSNEHRKLRSASEHLYSPIRLPLSGINVLNTGIAPLFNPGASLVMHIKTMHAFAEADSVPPLTRAYRRMTYPRSVRLADAVIINSESLRSEVNRYLDVEPSKLRLIREAVDHELFAPGDAAASRARLTPLGVTKPFVLFVSSLWQYKNCDGLLRAWAHARREMEGHQLVIVGPERDEQYAAGLHALVAELGISEDVVFVGGVPLEETVHFYRAADVFVYPSLNETFGLPILEAMACGCPVVTSSVTAMPETAGGAAILTDPTDPGSIAAGIVTAAGPDGARLRDAGLRRAAEFTWAATGAATLDVYREVGERRKQRRR